MSSIKLPETVAKAYKVAPGAVQVFMTVDLGRIDLNTINNDIAAKLVDKGVLIAIKEDKKS